MIVYELTEKLFHTIKCQTKKKYSSFQVFLHFRTAEAYSGCFFSNIIVIWSNSSSVISSGSIFTFVLTEATNWLALMNFKSRAVVVGTLVVQEDNS